jgi:hypothetical protein
MTVRAFAGPAPPWFGSEWEIQQREQLLLRVGRRTTFLVIVSDRAFVECPRTGVVTSIDKSGQAIDR